jgi:NADPH-dependent curcumin reductase CurA
LREAPIPSPSSGEVLVRNHFLSVDPYMRGRLDDARSYVQPQKVGDVMQGATAGEVVESKHPGFAVGDSVSGGLGWQEYGVAKGEALRKLDTSRVAMSAYLGVAGMPGVTAWYGLWNICKPKPGETLVVSAAAGAVGSVVGQLAKLANVRVIGIAGGPDKCKHVVRELGFDVCVDYKAGNLLAELERAAPNRIDCLFENVGGAVFDASLAHMNSFGRVAVCGLISGYDGGGEPLAQVRSILTNRLLVQGFIISEHLEIWPRAQSELASQVASGRLKYRETVTQGLDQAPDALIGLLTGQNLGKQIVKLVP